MTRDLTHKAFDTVTGDGAGESGFSAEAEHNEPANFLRHVLALSASKVADGLIDPKLVLSWILSTLGAGAFWAGLLVPVRESGALLPQLLTTPYITRSRVRKWFWAGGAFVQGLMAAAIAGAALTLEGGQAGLVIVSLLGVLALARSVCSASYKDILGKTVGKSRRGTATGFASSAAAAGVVIFAGLLMLGVGDRFALVTAAVGLAACLWIGAAAVFATLQEDASEPAEDVGSIAQFSLLRRDPQLARFIVTRSLLVGTALAPPYLVLLRPGSTFGQLGALVLASAVAALLSSYVWGRLSDRSSRRVLQLSGLAGGTVLALVVLVDLVDLSGVPGVIPVLLFGLMIAYQGVRQGRSTHLVDMADEDNRAHYTALSNTIVGIVLLVAGAAIAAVAAFSVPVVIGLLAALCFLAAMTATGLDEVQHD